MQVVLLVIQLLVAIALIGIILIQRSSQDGGGLTGGTTTMGGLFTARGSANLLTRATAFLAFVFIVNSLALGYLAAREHGQGSAFDQIQADKVNEPTIPPAEGAPNPSTVPGTASVPAPSVPVSGDEPVTSKPVVAPAAEQPAAPPSVPVGK